MSNTPPPAIPDLAAGLHQLHQQLEELREQNMTLRTELTSQRSAITAQSAQTAQTAHQSTTKEPKVNMPKLFNGNRAEFRGFINQVEILFTLNPLRYAVRL